MRAWLFSMLLLFVVAVAVLGDSDEKKSSEEDIDVKGMIDKIWNQSSAEREEARKNHKFDPKDAEVYARAARLLQNSGWELGPNFDEFLAYQKKFGYKLDEAKLAEEMRIFEENEKELEALQKKRKEENVPYELGQGPYMMMKPEDFQENILLDASEIGLPEGAETVPLEEAEKLWEETVDVQNGWPNVTGQVTRAKRGVIELPESWDWRQAGVITPIKNQGDCNSCWAFTTVAMMESHHAIKTGRATNWAGPIELLDLSEQQMGCMDQAKSAARGVCDPANTWNALTYLQTGPGLGLETEAPYHTEGDMGCYPTNNPKVKVAKPVWLDKAPTEKIKEAIYYGGPIAMAMLFNEDFQFYKNGVFTRGCENDKMGGHAMLMIGWGKEDGLDYWLIKNSWGEHWGENGFMKVQAGVNLCDIETRSLFQATIE